MSTSKSHKLIEALEPKAQSEGIELVDVVVSSQGGSGVVRVLLDKEGLTVDDLAACSGWVSEVVETADPFKGSYTLEVSSPGVDRPLRTLEHFERFVGQDVHVTTEPLASCEVAADTSAAQGTSSSETSAAQSACAGETSAAQGTKRGKWSGILQGVTGNDILLEVDGSTYKLPFKAIKKANLVGKVVFNRKDD